MFSYVIGVPALLFFLLWRYKVPALARAHRNNAWLCATVAHAWMLGVDQPEVDITNLTCQTVTDDHLEILVEALIDTGRKEALEYLEAELEQLRQPVIPARMSKWNQQDGGGGGGGGGGKEGVMPTQGSDGAGGGGGDAGGDGAGGASTADFGRLASKRHLLWRDEAGSGDDAAEASGAEGGLGGTLRGDEAAAGASELAAAFKGRKSALKRRGAHAAAGGAAPKMQWADDAAAGGSSNAATDSFFASQQSPQQSPQEGAQNPPPPPSQGPSSAQPEGGFPTRSLLSLFSLKKPQQQPSPSPPAPVPAPPPKAAVAPSPPAHPDAAEPIAHQPLVAGIPAAVARRASLTRLGSRLPISITPTTPQPGAQGGAARGIDMGTRLRLAAKEGADAERARLESQALASVEKQLQGVVEAMARGDLKLAVALSAQTKRSLDEIATASAAYALAMQGPAPPPAAPMRRLSSTSLVGAGGGGREGVRRLSSATNRTGSQLGGRTSQSGGRRDSYTVAKGPGPVTEAFSAPGQSSSFSRLGARLSAAGTPSAAASPALATAAAAATVLVPPLPQMRMSGLRMSGSTHSGIFVGAGSPPMGLDGETSRARRVREGVQGALRQGSRSSHGGQVSAGGSTTGSDFDYSLVPLNSEIILPALALPPLSQSQQPQGPQQPLTLQQQIQLAHQLSLQNHMQMQMQLAQQEGPGGGGGGGGARPPGRVGSSGFLGRSASVTSQPDTPAASGQKAANLANLGGGSQNSFRGSSFKVGGGSINMKTSAQHLAMPPALGLILTEAAAAARLAAGGAKSGARRGKIGAKPELAPKAVIRLGRAALQSVRFRLLARKQAQLPLLRRFVDSLTQQGFLPQRAVSAMRRMSWHFKTGAVMLRPRLTAGHSRVVREERLVATIREVKIRLLLDWAKRSPELEIPQISWWEPDPFDTAGEEFREPPPEEEAEEEAGQDGETKKQGDGGEGDGELPAKAKSKRRTVQDDASEAGSGTGAAGSKKPSSASHRPTDAELADKEYKKLLEATDEVIAVREVRKQRHLNHTLGSFTILRVHKSTRASLA